MERNEMIDYLDGKLALAGYRDYIAGNLGGAVEVVSHGGTMFDLDNIVQLERLLGMEVSYELYSYLDGCYDNLMEVSQDGGMADDIMEHVGEYMQGASGSVADGKGKVETAMGRLGGLVELAENNMECVVLKVKEGARMQLICLGCFNGDEEMFRLTKGGSHTCTVFYKDGRTSSWHWGADGYTLVSGQTRRCGELVQGCIEDDFGIYIGDGWKEREDTLHIRTLEDAKGREEHYRLMWWKEYGDICIHRNGCFNRHMDGLENALAWVGEVIAIREETEVCQSPDTGCYIMDVYGYKR